MKSLRFFTIITFLALLLAASIFAVRVARHYGGARAEIAQFKITQLDDATVERLRTLKDKVFLTYFASPRSEMPSHMRDMERNVHDLFEALKGASNGMLDYQIVDPHRSTDLERFAANRKISRIRTRSVSHDAYSEKTVWSGVWISYGTYPPATVNGIEQPEHLERLQSMIVGHLNQMEHPRLPVVAIAAPNGGANYKDLASALSEPDKNTKKIKAKVINFDFQPGTPIPREADILFWMEPAKSDPRQIRELNLFLASGHCAVVAGSEFAGEPVMSGADVALSVIQTKLDLEGLLSEFGLHPATDLVFDARCGELIGGTNNEKINAPYLLRVIGYNQDFRTMRGRPNGTLYFMTPTVLTLDAQRLAEHRWSADLLVTSSDTSWVAPVPVGPVSLKSLTVDKGEPVAMQPLMVGLRHDSPFHGNILFCGATTPFIDAKPGKVGYSSEGTAHWRLLKVLLDTYGSDERLVQNQAGLGRLSPIPEMSPGQKILWRAAALLLLPLGLLILAFARGALRFGTNEEKKLRIGPPVGVYLGVRGGAALAAIVLLGFGTRALAARVDLTEDHINQLAAETREITKRATESTKVDCYFSSHEHLPPAMRPLVARVHEVLRDLRRAGANLDIQYTETDDLDARERAVLETSGVKPEKVTIQDEEATVTKVVYSAIRLKRGARTETLQFPSLVSFENLEFRLAFALWRLETGKTPHIGFASDVPRLTPAEDYDDSKEQLLPPKGNDVYSVARELLKDSDFKVTHINPRDPTIPNDIDLLIWLQPRRDVSKMYEAFAKYLHKGGRGILAVQHYNMQSRQYRGGERRYDFVYWPQPQFNDVDNMYFPDIGIKMPLEVLFDDLKTHIVLDAQVYRTAIKEYKPMESALPFAVRASAANFAKDSIITKTLEDQALLFSSFIETDAARLRDLGITAKSLIFTSGRSWTYAWKGGWIPTGLLEWPPHRDPNDEQRSAFGGAKDDPWRLAPRVPLAVLFEGNFPESGPLSIQSSFPGAGNDAESRSSRPETRPQPAGKPGTLLMFGCSEAFKNYRILEKEFRADHLLINAASSLALEPELAKIATRRPVSRGFELQDSDERGRWRTTVVFLVPMFIAIFGIFYSLARAAAGVRRKN
ncbi:MAG: Gldg family protein [Planctomycetes bacterium]|nr:Gldg family protein [Planctomycetota bacterium]